MDYGPKENEKSAECTSHVEAAANSPSSVFLSFQSSSSNICEWKNQHEIALNTWHLSTILSQPGIHGPHHCCNILASVAENFLRRSMKNKERWDMIWFMILRMITMRHKKRMKYIYDGLTCLFNDGFEMFGLWSTWCRLHVFFFGLGHPEKTPGKHGAWMFMMEILWLFHDLTPYLLVITTPTWTVAVNKNQVF